MCIVNKYINIQTTTTQLQQISTSTTSTTSTTAEEKNILCPFLRIIEPRTDNMFTFMADLHKAGISWLFSLFFTVSVTYLQLGYKQALALHAPNIYVLKEVPGVTHDDKYVSYKAFTKEYLDAKQDDDGMISLQQLVDLKHECAKKAHVDELIGASKIETVLTFLASGGDVDSGKVYAEEVWRFLNGERPSGDINISWWRVFRANMKVTKWQYQ